MHSITRHSFAAKITKIIVTVMTHTVIPKARLFPSPKQDRTKRTNEAANTVRNASTRMTALEAKILPRYEVLKAPSKRQNYDTAKRATAEP